MKIQAARQLITILLVVVNYDVIQCDEGTLKLSTLSEGMFFFNQINLKPNFYFFILFLKLLNIGLVF